MRSSVKSLAIVIKKKSLLNADSIITFLTPEFGKLRAYARGIKKITSRRLPHTQTGNFVKIILRHKDERYYLEESEMVSAFAKIKKETTKCNFLYFMFFIIDRLIPENQEDQLLFRTVKRFMIDLSEQKKFSRVEFMVHMNKLLEVLGYRSTSPSFSALCLTLEEIMQEKLPLFSI